MYFLIVFQLIISVIYVAYLIYNYSLNSVGWFVKISVYLTWFICFSNVVLLPFDIYYSLEENYSMGALWKSSYWLIFFLTWILLPIAQEYEAAGEFSVKEKLKRAVINNLIIYGIFLAVGVLGLGYIVIRGKISLYSLPPVLLAASNAFGMFLLVIFLSYGIIAIPRSMWRFHKIETQIKKYQFDAYQLAKRKDKTTHELELKVKEVLWKSKKDGESVETVEILKLVPSDLLEKWSQNIPDLGNPKIVKLHKEIKEISLELNRLHSRWDEITISAFKIEDIISYMDAPNRRIESTIFNQYQYQILNYLQWGWYCRGRYYLIPFAAGLFSLFAIAIIIAELAVFIPFMSFMNPFSHLLNIKSFIGLDLILLTLLGYMSFCVYYALFKLKFSSFYGLYWNKQTDAASLIFFAINCSRITNPLNYNFLQVINDNSSSFELAMGQMPVMGESLKILFPILIFILILFNVFNIYSRICKKLGIRKFQFENDFDDESIHEGKRLLERARSDLQNKILSSNCKNLAEFRSYKSTQSGSTTALSTNKDSSLSEEVHVQPNYFNEFPDMQKFAKILAM